MNKYTTEFSTLLCGRWFMYNKTMYMKISPLHIYDDNFNAIDSDGYLEFFEQDVLVYRIKIHFSR